MFLLGIALAWFTFLSLFVGWCWIVGIAIAENDALVAVLCAVLPPYMLLFALLRLDKTGIPLTLLLLGWMGVLFTKSF